jgi:regulator of sirC expression with transglutaminase-like and TPR domain
MLLVSPEASMIIEMCRDWLMDDQDWQLGGNISMTRVHMSTVGILLILFAFPRSLPAQQPARPAACAWKACTLETAPEDLPDGESVGAWNQYEDGKRYIDRIRNLPAAAPEYQEGFQRALHSFDEAIKLGWKDHHIHNYRGWCFLELKRLHQAIEAYTVMLQLVLKGEACRD